jgi:hypothetical protein
MKYEGNTKHKHPWQPGRKGSLCPPDISPEKAQELLEQSIEYRRHRYATFGGKAYAGLPSSSNEVFHGYPIGFREVPPTIRATWIREGKITNRDIRKHWQGSS